jgi:hypothetical protein
MGFYGRDRVSSSGPIYVILPGSYLIDAGRRVKHIGRDNSVSIKTVRRKYMNMGWIISIPLAFITK